MKWKLKINSTFNFLFLLAWLLPSFAFAVAKVSKQTSRDWGFEITVSDGLITPTNFQTIEHYLSTEPSIDRLRLNLNDCLFHNAVNVSANLKSLMALLQRLPKLNELVLDLSTNNIGKESVQVFSEGLKKLTGLKKFRLILEKNPLTDEGIKALAEALEHLVELEELTLEFDFTEMSDDGALALLKAFQNLPKLRGLIVHIQGNRLTDLSLRALRQFFVTHQGDRVRALHCDHPRAPTLPPIAPHLGATACTQGSAT